MSTAGAAPAGKPGHHGNRLTLVSWKDHRGWLVFPLMPLQPRNAQFFYKQWRLLKMVSVQDNVNGVVLILHIHMRLVIMIAFTLGMSSRMKTKLTELVSWHNWKICWDITTTHLCTSVVCNAGFIRQTWMSSV